MDDTELYTTLLGIRPPWRVTRVQVNMAAERVDVWVEEAPGTKFPCASCRAPAAVYDHTPEQVWRHLDTCQCATYVHARLPRTACPVDGVRQVPAPWAEGRSEATRLFEARILDTCKECDVTGVRRLLRTTWDATWGVLERAVARGLRRKPRRVPARLGIDEKAVRKGHHYETLVVDLDTGTVEAVLDDRTQASLEAYYRQFTPEELATIEAIAMDMWEPYILATHACVPDAARKIVFDKYHATRYVTEAVDQVRRQEHKALQAQNDQRLTGTKHLWLWNEENVPEWRRAEFEVLKCAELKTSRAWAIKESLRGFWAYVYPRCAEKYFAAWYFWATHSRLTPIIEAARTLKRHLPNLLTYFKHWITNATSEGINSKIQTLKLMACGYRNREHYKTAILFHCGGLDLTPRPEAG
ncbi:MAG TPA: ISL3 family transposase [Candidatus Acidoferrum sp.]|nr:ISL3 family transposase [Candidatus Acidoferrum sp.]